MTKYQPQSSTSDEFSSSGSSDESNENNENLRKVGLDVLQLPTGEFRRPKHFVESSDSSDGEVAHELKRFNELKDNAKHVKLSRNSKEKESGGGRYARNEDLSSSTSSSDFTELDDSRVPEELKKWLDVSMYPEAVVQRLIQYVPRDSSEDLSDLDLVVARPVFFPENELNGDKRTTSRGEDFGFCKPGCHVGKTADHAETILQMNQDAMIKELREEMEAVGADNVKKYFSSDYFTQLFEKQVIECGIHDGSDAEPVIGPKEQTLMNEPSSSNLSRDNKTEEKPSQRKSIVSNFRNVEASGAKSKKVTESLLRSSTDKVNQDGNLKEDNEEEEDGKEHSELEISPNQVGGSRERLSTIPEETRESQGTGEYEQDGSNEEKDILLDYEESVKAMSQSELIVSHLSDMEKMWLMFLKVSLSGLEKNHVKVKPVKSNVREQFKNQKDPVEPKPTPEDDNEVPALQIDDEVSAAEASNLKKNDQAKIYKDGETLESLTDFGLEEDFVDVKKPIPAQRNGSEMSSTEKEFRAYQSDSSLVDSDEMDEINANFSKNIIITPDSAKIKKLVDIPYYLIPPDVRAPIKIGTSLQEAQDKMFATMGQNYFSTRIVYAFEFDPKKLSHENLTSTFRDYVLSQNAGYKDLGLLAGCLFTYEHNYQGIVLVEGGEYQITRHFADLKSTRIYHGLKKSRILFVHTYIQEQYLKKWILVATNPPIGTAESPIEAATPEEGSKENLQILTEKLTILFQHLEHREPTINAEFTEIDLPIEVHLKLPAPQLIDSILDYYALRPLHKFIEEIHNIPDTHDSSEDETIFPEDVPYYAIQPEKYELSDILDYMVEDKSLRRKKLLERDVRKKMEAEGKPYKEQVLEDEHDLQLMYDIDDLESVRRLDVDTVYTQKLDESIKAKLSHDPYGRDLEGYERFRRFKGRPDLFKMKKTKKKKKEKKVEEAEEEIAEEQLEMKTEEDEIIEEIFGEAPRRIYDQNEWIAVSDVKMEPTEPADFLEEVHGEKQVESARGKRKPYRKLFRYSPEYKVPYREVGPAASESKPSTAGTLTLGEDELIERGESGVGIELDENEHEAE